MAESHEDSLIPEADEGLKRGDEAIQNPVENVEAESHEHSLLPDSVDEGPKQEDETVQNPVENVEVNPETDQNLSVTECGAKVEDEVKEVESKIKIIHDPWDSATEPGDNPFINSPGTPSNLSTDTQLPSFAGLAQSFPDKKPEGQSEIEVVEEQVDSTPQRSVSNEPKNSLTEASPSPSTPTGSQPVEDSARSSQGRNIHFPPRLQNPFELYDRPPLVLVVDSQELAGEMRGADVQNPAGSMQANPQADQAPAIAACSWAKLVQVVKRIYAETPNSIRVMLVMAFLVLLLVVAIAPIIWPHSYT